MLLLCDLKTCRVLKQSSDRAQLTVSAIVRLLRRLGLHQSARSN